MHNCYRLNIIRRSYKLKPFLLYLIVQGRAVKCHRQQYATASGRAAQRLHSTSIRFPPFLSFHTRREHTVGASRVLQKIKVRYTPYHRAQITLTKPRQTNQKKAPPERRSRHKPSPNPRIWGPSGSVVPRMIVEVTMQLFLDRLAIIGQHGDMLQPLMQSLSLCPRRQWRVSTRVMK